VDFEITGGVGSLTIESSLTDETGRTSTRLIPGPKDGEVVVQAKVFGSGDMVFFTATAASVSDTSGAPVPGSTATAEIPTEGLVAYFPFNGNAVDESGNGNDGESHGAVLTEDRFGDPNGAYWFDGKDDYIVTAKPIGISGNSPRSVIAWVRVSSLNENTSIIYWGTQDHVAGLNGFYASEELFGRRSLFRFRGHYRDIDSGKSDVILFEKWQQLAFTFDGTLGLLYVDGVVTAAQSLFLETDDTAMSFGINLRDEGIDISLNRYFHGALDDVRIYSTAVPGEEVKALYNRLYAK
jgi:hypothetical protein